MRNAWAPSLVAEVQITYETGLNVWVDWAAEWSWKPLKSFADFMLKRYRVWAR